MEQQSAVVPVPGEQMTRLGASRTRSLRVPVAAAALVALGCLAGAADWPQFRGPNRDGTSPEEGLFAVWPPEKLWTASVGVGYSPPTVADGRAYLVGHERGEGERGTDTVYCLDAATGKELWKYSYACLSTKKDKKGEYPGPRATPAVDSGALYMVSLEGRLFCLRADTGEVLWSKNLEKYAKSDEPLQYGYCASPLIHGDHVICHINGACMAFDKKSGKPRWRSSGGNGPWNVPSPVIVEANGSTCVVFGEKALVGALAETGRKLWEYPLGRTSTMTPVVAGDMILFSTYPNRGRCGAIRPPAPGGSDPEAVWLHREIQVYHLGSPVVVDGHLYAIDAARTEFAYSDDKISSLKCLELETGRAKWVEKRMGWAQVIAADGKLVILRETGELVVAEATPEGYKELGREKVIEGPTWGIPALADGRLFCRNNEGAVVCLQVGTR